MAISVDDFLEKATEPQKQLLFKLVELGQQEHNIREKYSEKIKSFEGMAEGMGSFKDGLYAKVTQEDAEDFAALSTKKERDELKRIRREMKELYIKSIELGMGELGIIQRCYENYVGEPIPKQ